MALTSVEKQAQFRERQKAKGLVRRSVWTDEFGFSSKTVDPHKDRPRITYRKFLKELNILTESLPDVSPEEIYFELLTVGKRLKICIEKAQEAKK